MPGRQLASRLFPAPGGPLISLFYLIKFLDIQHLEGCLRVMTKAYSYIRMSTPEQLKGDSSRRQQKATDDYIREQGWQLAEIIEDHGVSAFKGKNVEFGALANFLRLAELGLIETGSYLIVESLDRLTRQNVFEAIALLNRIIQLGVNVVTLIDRRVYSKESVARNEADLMIASITMMRAHEESRTKSVRLSAAWEQKRKVARSGKVTRQNLPHWLRISPDGQRIEVIEDRASLVREIFELSRDGWGSYSIAKELNRRGVGTWGRSDMWQESYIKKLLDNRSLIGEFQPYKTFSETAFKQRAPDGRPISGYYPVVIDEVLFAEARESMLKRRTSGAGRKGANYPNLFTGVLQCGFCKSGVRFIDKGQPPKGGQYLRCSKAVLTRECSATSMRYREIETLLLNLIRDVNFNTAVNGVEWESELHQLKSLKIQHEQSAEELSEKIGRIVDAIAELPNSVDLRAKLRSLDEQKQAAMDSARDAQTKISELSMSSANDRGELLKRLNDAAIDGDEKIRLRRKVNAEIRRFIRTIRLSPQSVYPYEMEGELDDDHRDVTVEVQIAYRNGGWHHFSKLDGADMFSPNDDRQKLMIDRAVIASRD